MRVISFATVLFATVFMVMFSFKKCSEPKPNIDRFASKLEEKGLEVEKEPDPYYGILKADIGLRLIVGGQRVEVYKFNTDHQKGRAQIKKLARGGFNGRSAIRKGPLLMFEVPRHDHWETIKKTFQRL